MLNDILLVCAAVIPAIALSIYIYKKDRVEKEPIGLLLLLFGLGAVMCFPAAKLESLMIDWQNDLFMPWGNMKDNTLYLPTDVFGSYMAVKAFAVVALVEEGLKFLVLVLVTKNNKHFNSLFDGIIYAVFVSLGFAAYENILYVLKYGWETAFTRAVYAVPGHTFFAIIMGYYYTLWNVYRKARIKEQKLLKDGYLTGIKKKFVCAHYPVLALLMPILAHGFYDYCCFMETKLWRLVLMIFVLFLYGYCFYRVYKMSENDVKDGVYANVLLRKKYPQLNEYLQQPAGGK